jgi:hypothetical protein
MDGTDAVWLHHLENSAMKTGPDKPGNMKCLTKTGEASTPELSLAVGICRGGANYFLIEEA